MRNCITGKPLTQNDLRLRYPLKSLCLIHFSHHFTGLFNKAILQGGYALSPLWSYQENHRERADELAQVLGFKGNHTKRLLRYLKQLPAEDIVEALNKLRKKLKEVFLSSFSKTRPDL